MKVAVRILLGSASFGLGIALIYWIVSAEAAGTALLVSFGIAPMILAGWVLLQRTPEDLPEDRPDADGREAAGEVIGSFPSESVWPIALAGASVLLLGGLVYGSALLVLGLLGLAVSVVGLMRESRG